MFSPVNEFKKNIVSINAFGGLNHTDAVRVGEWYSMCNLSDRYAPLLAPRRSRDVSATIPAKCNEVLLKNGLWYYTVNGVGIYCYAPDGNNPFRDKTWKQPVLIYESKREYKLLEMGNSIICIPNDESATAISIKDGKIRELGYNEKYNFYSKTYNPARDTVGNLETYLPRNKNNEAVYYFKPSNGENTFNITRTTVEGGTIDEHAATLLNVAFSYQIATEDNEYYFINNERNRYAPTKNNFEKDTYFLGTDNKFYFFDYDSKAVTEITSPNIAIVFNLGRDLRGDDSEASLNGAFPELQNGDYINLTIGTPRNLKHPLCGNGLILDKQPLRVVKHNKFAETSDWYSRGFRDVVIVEYNAKFITTLIKKNLFYNSVSYKMPSTAPNNDDADRGIKQLYPEFVKIEHSFPVISIPVEKNNRIWGANNINNELKASAQGNFEVWNDYRGLISDSYAVSIGSNDKFTASCAIEDYLFFFKEHSYTLIYGTRPANFTTNTVNEFIGMNEQGAKSLQVIGKSAYYMGIDGRVYRFNGATAEAISHALGEELYTPLSSAHTQEKYYLLVEHESSGERNILVYNTTTGMWWTEDAQEVEALTTIRGEAVALSYYKADGRDYTDIILLDKWKVPKVEQNTIEWECESGLLGLESDFYQYISNLKITFESEVGASLEVLAQFDNDTAYTPLASFISERKTTRTEKIRVRRCEFMRLKLRGRGFSKVHRISYLTAQGSEK